MNLSDGEKLILLMLSDLYERLDVDGEIEGEFIKTAILNNQLWGIKWKYSGVPFEETEGPPLVREVLDILDMWSCIEYSYNHLSVGEKAALETGAAPFGRDPRFEGFDDNNETEYMGTAMFLVSELERFQEFKGRSFNCHHPSIETHRRMLGAFEPIRKRLSSGLLSLADLTLILKEKIHPSRRT